MVMIASICNDFILLLNVLVFCITVMGGKLQSTLRSSHEEGMKGYVHDAHHRLCLQQYSTMLSCSRDLRQRDSSSTSIFAWPKVNSVHTEVNGKNPINFSYVLWVINFSLEWPLTFTLVFPALITLRIFHNCHNYYSCLLYSFYWHRQTMRTKYWYVFITNSRNSWGWDSGTRKFFYPQNIFA